MKRATAVLTSLLIGTAFAAPVPEREAKQLIKAPADGWDFFFGGCSWYCGAPRITVSASSFLTEGTELKHPANRAHDKSMAKVWSEGVKGNGIGENLTFTFHTTKKNTTDLGVTVCAIGSGHQGSERLFLENARPKLIELSMDGKAKVMLRLKDSMGLQWFEIPKLALERPSEHTITLKIMEVYPGTKFEDTCIAEVYFQGTGQMH